MALNETKTEKSFGDKLLSVPRWVWFILLVLATAIPLRFPQEIPNDPSDSAADLYRELMALPEGSTVIIQSDWTNSTRGESRGQFDALLRILMRKKVKFGLMSVADTQAPEVARNAIDDINRERVLAKQPEYKRWDDWVNLGYFPNAEGKGQEIAQNIRDAFKGIRDKNRNGIEDDVLKSPVMANIKKVGDLSAFIIVTGTKSIIIAIERLQKEVKMLGMVTGVMGPETLNYYLSSPKQLKGLSAGLKGVYDMESMMENGVNTGKNKVRNFSEQIPGWPGEKNIDKGSKYYWALHVAIGLLIIAVIIGNVGVLLTRNRTNA